METSYTDARAPPEKQIAFLSEENIKVCDTLLTLTEGINVNATHTHTRARDGGGSPRNPNELRRPTLLHRFM